MKKNQLTPIPVRILYDPPCSRLDKDYWLNPNQFSNAKFYIVNNLVTCGQMHKIQWYLLQKIILFIWF